MKGGKSQKRPPGRAREPLGYLLAIAFRRVKARVQERLDPYRLTPPQLGLLRWLCENGDDEGTGRRVEGTDRGVMASEIASRVRVDLPSVTRILYRLERAGLVARHRDARDRRRVLIEPTPRGRRLFRVVRPVAEACQREVLRGLRPAEVKELKRLLGCVIENTEVSQE